MKTAIFKSNRFRTTSNILNFNTRPQIRLCSTEGAAKPRDVTQKKPFGGLSSQQIEQLQRDRETLLAENRNLQETIEKEHSRKERIKQQKRAFWNKALIFFLLANVIMIPLLKQAFTDTAFFITVPEEIKGVWVRKKKSGEIETVTLMNGGRCIIETTEDGITKRNMTYLTKLTTGPDNRCEGTIRLDPPIVAKNKELIIDGKSYAREL